MGDILRRCQGEGRPYLPVRPEPSTTKSARELGGRTDGRTDAGPASPPPGLAAAAASRAGPRCAPPPGGMSYKPNLTAHMPAASLNAGHPFPANGHSDAITAGSVHPPSTSMATSSQYRQLLNDYGPPSLGYTQEEKRARARERDRLKKRRRREDGLKRSLERQRNALAMRRWREQRKEECGATRRRRQDAEDLDQEKRKDLETKQQRQQRRREEQGTGNSQVPQSKYAELLAIIEELGKEIRPTYAGSKSAMERLKRGIIHARGLVRECLAETERNARS